MVFSQLRPQLVSQLVLLWLKPAGAAVEVVDERFGEADEDGLVPEEALFEALAFFLRDQGIWAL
jgi:hypothetical protein